MLKSLFEVSMPKLNYIRGLLDGMDEEKLKNIIESYSKQDKSFEAYVIDQSGQAVDTGKSYEDFHEETQKLLSKCTSRNGFVKVTRLKKAGLDSYQKMLQAHFSNENFITALWMSLALSEMLHSAILMNTRYRWANKPYKSFEKMLAEARELFDSCMKVTDVSRKRRGIIFKALLNCWWTERQRDYDHHYFEVDDVFKYAERDEDYVSLQLGLQELPDFHKIEKKKNASFSEKLSYMLKPSRGQSENLHLPAEIEEMKSRIRQGLDEWN